MGRFLDSLDREWAVLSTSAAATRALEVWSLDPALCGFADLGEVVARLHRRGRPEEADRILLALLRRAPEDPLSARTVLQAMMPGLKSLMSAYRLTGDSEEVATDVVEAAYERIRRYPCDRRPTKVAANLVWDTRQTLWRAAQKEAARLAPLEPITNEMADELPDMSVPSPTEELVDLVAEAVRRDRLPRPGARLVLLTRVADIPVEELAAESGAKAQTLRQLRRRAEAALGHAAVA
jgi:DNA-directed RNA polymerase specialized sigma24 family protein